jgi:hypothetical protein
METMTILTQCPDCGHGEDIVVNERDYFRWRSGMFVQDAFPYLSADEREMIKTGICPDCWDLYLSDID